MSRLGRTLLLTVLATGIVSAGAFGSIASAQQSVTVPLAPQNNSGMSGTATLTPMGNQTQVVIQVANAPGPHPAHIHEGTCANLNPSPRFPLTAVQGGRSETMVNATLQQILASPHAINLHKSPQEATVYTSCGNIMAAASAQAPRSLPSTGEAEDRTLPALAIAGATLLGAGVLLRRRAM